MVFVKVNVFLWDKCQAFPFFLSSSAPRSLRFEATGANGLGRGPMRGTQGSNKRAHTSLGLSSSASVGRAAHAQNAGAGVVTRLVSGTFLPRGSSEMTCMLG